ncbi:MAG: bifunctional serine/threonine-protein kinase/formylglycine-generating enzyme family protein [Candidatus Cloacimonadaceae bacterium]|nr:bifunctional serine/threonine-protein kinase/formylglycine-generating enzyme family protein [Candidatus Cloacimonadaceae bacterium]
MNGQNSSSAYAILGTLQKSKLHTVYKAKNFFSGKLVTIKTNDIRWKNDPELHRQLKQESETGTLLDHPNIRGVIGLFEEDGNAYLVADYIEGIPLNEFLEQKKVDTRLVTALSWIKQLLSALEYAHAKGIAHLNLDPSNMIISGEGELTLIGFGKDPRSWLKAETYDDHLHPVMFVAPELFKGERFDHRADLYSVGVLAYYLICNRYPWSLDPKLSATLQKQQSLARPVLDPEILGREIPRWIFSIINQSLMLDPASRFSSATDILTAIDNEHELTYSSVLIFSDSKQQQTPEPILIPEPEPVSQPETPSHAEITDNVFEESIIPIEPQNTETPLPIPPKPKPILKPEPMIVPESDSEEKSMKKLFGWMLVISVLILLFVVLKYGILERPPRFEVSKAAGAEDGIIAHTPAANRLIGMILVKGDSTAIGSVGPEADDDEFPPRELYIRDFYITPCEITQEQWSMVYPDYYFDRSENDLPIVNVSFYDVIDFCNEKSIKDGFKPVYEFYANGFIADFNKNGYRLPTEAEWEYAAKGGEKVKFPRYSGSDNADDIGWYKDNSDAGIKPVGQKKPNQLGLYDMSGNAFEWVWNWYSRYAYSQQALFEGPSTGTDKVIRGGSWFHEKNFMRVTNRNFEKPHKQARYIGFRLVRSAL